MKKRQTRRKQIISGILSLIIPGLGQIYSGKNRRGATILVAAIIIANLNIIILPLIAMANPDLPIPGDDPNAVWKYWIPRIVHDIASIWSIVFWVWAVVDAYKGAKKDK
jgi:TM2 domain-containing membrane protein YozV